jgi:hypothetical protein
MTLEQAVEAIEREARWHEGVARSALSPVAAATSRGRSQGLRAAARVVREVEGFDAPPTLSLRVGAVEQLGRAVVIVEGEGDEGLVRAAVPAFDAPEVGEVISVERWQLVASPPSSLSRAPNVSPVAWLIRVATPSMVTSLPHSLQRKGLAGSPSTITYRSGD